MPISSQYIGQMIAGQQAMFGNMTSYAQQISPGYNGPPVGYGYPQMGQYGDAYPPSPMTNPDVPAFGTQALSAMGHVGLPVMGGLAAAAMGIDPFTMGLKGFARGAGFQQGVGVMSNLGRIASGGVGSIARAGLGGMAGAASAAALPLAAGAAMTYGVNQMVGGAQFANATTSFLNQNFRFQNQSSETGYGFSRSQGGDVASMMREMGSQDFYTSAGELLNVMKQGTGMGMFKAVQDVREFKTKFKEMVGVVKEIAMTMNTTLEGAMPFLASARQQGFWTPQDIMRSGTIARTTAIASGMTVAQTQGMMQQGADMARAIGARGQAGAVGITQAAQLVGGALRSGVISEQELQEYTGLQGGAAVQAMATSMQGATTNFARSGHARWLMAALGGKGFKGFDAASLDRFRSGQMRIGEMGSLAQRNIGKEGAFNFVMNEEELREGLLKMGPEAQAGFVQSVVGDRLYGDSAQDKYITRRLIGRYFGKTGREADMMAKMAREMPAIMRENWARTQAQVESNARDKDIMENQSWEGMRRKIGKWWDENINDPLQKIGQNISQSLSNTYERFTDRMFGRTASYARYRGPSALDIRGYVEDSLGSATAGTDVFGSQPVGRKTWDLSQREGKAGSLLGTAVGATVGGIAALGLTAVTGGAALPFIAAGAAAGGLGGSILGRNAQGRNPLRDVVQQWGITDVNRPDQDRISRFALGMQAVTSGQMEGGSAEALGFSGADDARTQIAAARKEIDSQAIIALMGLKGESKERASAAVRMINAGGLGGAGMKGLVKGGTEQEKIMRIGAMIPEELRESLGLDFKTEKQALGQGRRTAQELEKDVEGKMEELRLAAGYHRVEGKTLKGETLTRGETNISMDTMKAMMELPNMKDNLRILAAPDRDGSHEAARLEIIKQSLGGSPEVREGVRMLLDPKNPNRQNIQNKLGALGKSLTELHSAEFARTMGERFGQLRQEMGSEFDPFMREMRKVGTGGGGSIESVISTLTSGKALDPASLQGALKQLGQFGQTGTPEQVARVKEVLSQYNMGKPLVGAIEAGQISRRLVERLRKDPRKGDLGSLNQMIESVGLTGHTVGKDVFKEGGIVKYMEGSGLKAGSEQYKRVQQMLESYQKITAKGTDQGEREKLLQTFMATGQDAAPIRGSRLALGAQVQRGKGTLWSVEEKIEEQTRVLKAIAKHGSGKMTDEELAPPSKEKKT